MTALAPVTRCPRPYNADRGAEARAAVPWADAPLADLVAGAAGCAPYIAQLVAAEGDWLETAAPDPRAAFDAELAVLRDLPPEADPSSPLRTAKRRAALLTALADLGGLWPLADITHALTELADTACSVALGAAMARARGAPPMPTIFAMGKMGAFELNYSSDIDLICLFDDRGFGPAEVAEARSGLARVIRRMTGWLNDVTDEGYVFRTDLRLRPDAGATPVCIAMSAAETYYETHGRTWERAAWVKARPCAGDMEAGDRFIADLRPFIWRRHLDFAAVRDAHDMRLAIREHKGLHGPITLPGHNLKLGRGGIREIEFFTQTRQIIAGGRDPSLRLRGTAEGLERLTRKGWVDADAAGALARHYRTLREAEHRVQMLRDAQTHDLPRDAAGFERLAAFMDMDRAALERHLSEALEEVNEITDRFFDRDAGRLPSDPAPVAPAVADESWLRYPALRSDRAAQIFRRLQPGILARLATADRPDEARAAFDRFLSGLPAGVQLFSLFDANPQLIDLLVEIVSVGPELAGYLSRHAEVFDAVIAGEFFTPWPGVETMHEALAAALAEERDYEAQLDTARRWRKDWQFRIGVHLLRGIVPPEEAARHYADLAEAVMRALWPVIVAHFAAKHGTPPGRGVALLGMGSLGAARLHARSDLDLIVIYDAGDATESDGPRPLAVRPYYARLTQALVTALTAPTAEGRLYEVDMRLRPSGNQGPVATSLTAFRDYQQDQAWTWEHMALTRARIVAGDAGVGADVRGFLDTHLSIPREAAPVLADLRDMRDRIAAAHGTLDDWEGKLGQGRLQDIELFAQAACLCAGVFHGDVDEGIAAAHALGWITEREAEALTDAHALCWRLRMAEQLIGPDVSDPDKLGAGGQAFIVRIAGQSDRDQLDAALASRSSAAAAVIDRVIAERAGNGPQ
ncbi:glutamine-synthetase adenylyltransferase [Pseudaestuariivita atlantica]|uniref:Glutamate-ammonia-ligase adenylyltransferase n=1 Tax=Pseudaestuariivita atlantica TaxID=1317121 RepID=A0A0L1JUL7_9RHOB|nr:glutamine-synthetase adenylyltransferase [Pseudaestuariivita atlantica]KNG95435.1 glutamate-ammonia-ligase adenylyltransferase [Pseudaestuariivita atlantica]